MLAQLHRDARQRLAAAGISSPDVDARLLVEHSTGTTRTDGIARGDQAVAAEAIATLDAALVRRIAGEPVHRIIGSREFYGLALSLSPGTLEPRPDTETLVDALLPQVGEAIERSGACRILDLGTGTGAIALALLSQAPRATAVGVDRSQDALATAQRNAEALGLAERFRTLRSDWFSAVHGKYHVIAANPPYIQSQEIADLAREVRLHDPRAALDGGPDGLDAYRAIAAGADRHLEHDGIIGLELGQGQLADVSRLFEKAGYGLRESRRDLGGIERVALFSRCEESP